MSMYLHLTTAKSQPGRESTPLYNQVPGLRSKLEFPQGSWHLRRLCDSNSIDVDRVLGLAPGMVVPL